jgi:hypothetical protein
MDDGEYGRRRNLRVSDAIGGVAGTLESGL